MAEGQPPSAAAGYGPLAPKPPAGGTDPTQYLSLPAGFNYQVISRQGQPMRDGKPTPGIFDAKGAFPDTGDGVNPTGDTTILIRNHENRERPGEVKVTTGPRFEYDEATFGGNTKLVVKRKKTGMDTNQNPVYEYTVADSFAILGGTSTNCTGGETPFKKWITCEEVVKGPGGGSDGKTSPKKHGYVFEVDAMSDGPVPAAPIVVAGRFVHEAAAWRSGVLYLTEDRRIMSDPKLGQIGACFYRYTPDKRVGQSTNLAETTGKLEALKVKGVLHKNMDAETEVGAALEVEWVTVDEPDHNDDTDNRRDRAPGFTPTRIQAQDKGAAYFDREEGIWVGQGGQGDAKVYFDCTNGGPNDLGQVWEYDPGRETITLIFQSPSSDVLQNPDNITIVPQTGDMFLGEDENVPDARGQFIRGLTGDGEIYDFAQTVSNDTEFCGACFDPDGQTLYVNQQGERGSASDPLDVAPNQQAVTYAIYGPFQKREGANNKNFGNGQSAGNGSGA
jgi:secreted PhoX family phosphatase